jgi:hypothetical protein
MNPWYREHLETVYGNKQEVGVGNPLLCSGLGALFYCGPGYTHNQSMVRRTPGDIVRKQAGGGSGESTVFLWIG